MGSGTPTDPGQPGTPPGVSVHAGDGEPDSSAAGPGPSPALATDDLTITLSDLKKMVGVVDAAVVLWNTLERTVIELAEAECHPTWFNEWALLRDALDDLEVAHDGPA